jgi:non-ribosomal peptide synthetase component E (peptide arylation enzyme)
LSIVWRRPHADAVALRAGWYSTGDTGYLGSEGDLFVTGRVDDMIFTGGRRCLRSMWKALCRCTGYGSIVAAAIAAAGGTDV